MTKEERSVYNKAWYQRNKAKHKANVLQINRQLAEKNKIRLAEYKLSRGCADCGYNKASEALDFDHLHSKLQNVGKMLTWSWNGILKEIAKCEVVCANCHRIRTNTRRKVHIQG